MVYALWNIESNNLVAERTSLDEALEVVRRGVERNGPDYAETLALDVADDQGKISPIAVGRELAAMADDARRPARSVG